MNSKSRIFPPGTALGQKSTRCLSVQICWFDPQKRQRCRAVLKTLKDDLRGVISTQVMQEFYVAATRKRPITGKSRKMRM
jgi:predicted nucleic acid-binding protein